MKLPKEIEQGRTITIKSDLHGTVTGKVETHGLKDAFYVVCRKQDKYGFPVIESSLLRNEDYKKTWKLIEPKSTLWFRVLTFWRKNGETKRATN